MARTAVRQRRDAGEPHGLGYDAPPFEEGPDGRLAGGRIDTGRLADLPPDKRAAVGRLDKIATLLDSQFKVAGIRFGIEPILGLIPGVGDVALGAFSAYLVFEAARTGARKRDLAKMGVNVLIDMTLGSIPLVGDVFDVFYKANKRNVRILRRHLAEDARR